MSDREARRGENESWFRAVNERLEGRAIDEGGANGEEFAILCECAREDCTQRLSVSVDEYEQVRANPRRFIVVRGHNFQAFERVLCSHKSYEIVEKFGEAGLVAQLDDPRRGT